MSFGEPSPTLAVRLGVRGTLEDAKRLFRDYDVPRKFMPLEIFLFDSMDACFVRFRATEHAAAARSWLIDQGKTLCQGYPPFTTADIGFSGRSLHDERYLNRRLRPLQKLHISGLGCRIDEESLGILLQPFGGVKAIFLPRNWLGASSGRAFVRFKTVQHATIAKNALDKAYFTGSGKRLTVEYEGKGDISDSMEQTPSTLEVKPPVNVSASYLRHLANLARQAPGLYHVWDANTTSGQPTAYLEFDNHENARRALAALNKSCGVSPPDRTLQSKIIFKPRYGLYTEPNPPLSSALRVSLGARESISDVIQAYQELKPLRIWLYDGEDSAFIVFASVEDAKAARKARNGQPLREGGPASLVTFAVRWDKAAGLKFLGSRTKVLHISGLGCRTTDEELHAFCHHHTDGLVGSKLKIHWTGISKGYGYLAYESIAGAEAALKKLHGTVYPHSGQEVSIHSDIGQLVENSYDGVYPE